MKYSNIINDNYLKIRCTKEEKEKWNDKAKHNDLSISEFVRNKLNEEEKQQDLSRYKRRKIAGSFVCNQELLNEMSRKISKIPDRKLKSDMTRMVTEFTEREKEIWDTLSSPKTTQKTRKANTK